LLLLLLSHKRSRKSRRENFLLAGPDGSIESDCVSVLTTDSFSPLLPITAAVSLTFVESESFCFAADWVAPPLARRVFWLP
jgi:hypothetical protein